MRRQAAFAILQKKRKGSGHASRILESVRLGLAGSHYNPADYPLPRRHSTEAIAGMPTSRNRQGLAFPFRSTLTIRPVRHTV